MFRIALCRAAGRRNPDRTWDTGVLLKHPGKVLVLAGGGLSVEVQTDWNRDLRSHGVESMFLCSKLSLSFP